MNRIVLQQDGQPDVVLIDTSDPLTVRHYGGLGDPCDVLCVTTRCYTPVVVDVTFSGKDATAYKSFRIRAEETGDHA